VTNQTCPPKQLFGNEFQCQKVPGISLSFFSQLLQFFACILEQCMVNYVQELKAEVGCCPKFEFPAPLSDLASCASASFFACSCLCRYYTELISIQSRRECKLFVGSGLPTVWERELGASGAGETSKKTAVETKILIDNACPWAYILHRSEHKVLAIKFVTNHRDWRELTTLSFISQIEA
jgi:hypothetical protein